MPVWTAHPAAEPEMLILALNLPHNFQGIFELIPKHHQIWHLWSHPDLHLTFTMIKPILVSLFLRKILNQYKDFKILQSKLFSVIFVECFIALIRAMEWIKYIIYIYFLEFVLENWLFATFVLNCKFFLHAGLAVLFSSYTKMQRAIF